MEKLGINKDWTLTKNACDLPMCTKNIGKTQLVIFEGINGEPCSLELFHNPYITDYKVFLKSYNFESACIEADTKYRDKILKAIDYLKEQLAVLPNPLKFWEFKEFEYYALIGAETKEEAIKFYEEVVSNIEEIDGQPYELTFEEAKAKFNNACKEDGMKEFEEFIQSNRPVVILIDSSLL